MTGYFHSFNSKQFAVFVLSASKYTSSGCTMGADNASFTLFEMVALSHIYVLQFQEYLFSFIVLPCLKKTLV